MTLKNKIFAIKTTVPVLKYAVGATFLISCFYITSLFYIGERLEKTEKQSGATISLVKQILEKND